jgi:ubiquinone/menaquinone biosynthesis C-methylase UbiE
VAADVTSLPFADATFDGATCGYVIEHVPDTRAGLAEIARVLRPGGRLLLLATEDTFSGAWTSRIWCCRTINRSALHETCESLGLHWRQELWFTPMHKALRAGGICVEIERR